MKLRILSLVLLALCLIAPAFAQHKMDKMDKKAPKMAKGSKMSKGTKMAKVAKVAKTQKMSESGKMKDLGHGVFQDSAGKYRNAKGQFMSKADAEAKLAGPARDPKTGRFVKKGAARDPKTGRFVKKGTSTKAPKMAKAPKMTKKTK